MGDYRKLKVYNKSYEAAKEIYREAARYPEEEKYGLTSQTKRAAVSIALNIAEGYGKGDSVRELLRYMYMARGSCKEVEVLLDFGKDFGYISERVYRELKAKYEEIGKMLTGYIQSQQRRNI